MIFTSKITSIKGSWWLLELPLH